MPRETHKLAIYPQLISGFIPCSFQANIETLIPRRFALETTPHQELCVKKNYAVKEEETSTTGERHEWWPKNLVDVLCFWDYASESDRDYKDAYYRNQPVYWTAIEVLNLCWGGEGNLFFFGMRCSQASKQEPFGWARSRPRSKWMCVTYIPVLRRC